jgi:hypothetical protein
MAKEILVQGQLFVGELNLGFSATIRGESIFFAIAAARSFELTEILLCYPSRLFLSRRDRMGNDTYHSVLRYYQY